MKKTMLTALMTGPRKIELVERDIPVPGPDQVLIRLEYVGICGSDLHILEKDWGGRVTAPHVLGHECAGVVVEAGSRVGNPLPGDRVAVEPGRTCGKCEYCRTGRYNLCREVKFLAAPNTPASPQVDGAFCEYLAHDADLCFKLPERLSTLEGALIEPLAVGFHAANQGGARPGQSAVVVGAGCIGLVSMMALRICGVARVFVCDIMKNRLAKAAELGADAAVDSRDPAAAADRLLELTGGAGCDLAVDTAGISAMAGETVRALKKGANLVLVGYSPDGSLVIPLREIINKEITLRSVFRYRNIYPMAIESAAAGLVDLKRIVSNVYPLSEAPRALAEGLENKASIVKSVLRMPVP
ncbi:MAG: NAD(P)-dependent alcohol dehydrogenase [Planctomycetota bacterium]|jgi:L-iditol 2-dehydrogenase|nr:NAD(P)-dependent alcohol dehydrogenase [Planctomycetota bacterium]